jgi:hypothetical protein
MDVSDPVSEKRQTRRAFCAWLALLDDRTSKSFLIAGWPVGRHVLDEARARIRAQNIVSFL